MQSGWLTCERMNVWIEVVVDPTAAVPVWNTRVKKPALRRAVAYVFADASVAGFVMTSSSSPHGW